jgi:hypothetical protein
MGGGRWEGREGVTNSAAETLETKTRDGKSTDASQYSIARGMTLTRLKTHTRMSAQRGTRQLEKGRILHVRAW